MDKFFNLKLPASHGAPTRVREGMGYSPAPTVRVIWRRDGATN